ncbi:helix-turn-helix domain-containing protein [Micromonospora aurantiaca (nom. illeg.)]|uniref:helix-turn-helix domain-containing protein n=1 Tax=Micromonospora aurantiaca (nom. illeg.) TaxID=47850 RepID=UPI00165744CA|nr:helix-turn-helix domain-containing protein [Micromonospora aurantiaca]MBC9006117.1 helix-turn-helix domain-containing protein [Micromonospora aurantiaca]
MTVDELTERSTEPAARERAERIRAGIHNYLETLAEIALAWERRDWQVLGYADWQAYVDGEFGAERLRLPVEHRQRAVAELRLAGMAQRAIGTVLGVDQSTVQRDLARGDASASPAVVRGADGKAYAATRLAPAAPWPAGGPEPGDRVWIATARKGIAAHALQSSMLTRCSRATRTGLTMTARQAVERWEATWCRACWPAEETTRFAAGEPVHAGPADETHDPRASREAGAERRDSAPASTTETAAGDRFPPADGAAETDGEVSEPAPAPAPPTASPAGGAGVTPNDDGLTPADAARLRAVFEWARAGLARHPRNAAGRGMPATLGLEYAPGEPTPPVYPQAAQRGQVAHVEVCWKAGLIDVVYRSDRYELDNLEFCPATVAQGVDLLCALGILPARFSQQYAAGVQAGLRRGAAIDGALIEEAEDA